MGGKKPSKGDSYSVTKLLFISSFCVEIFITFSLDCNKYVKKD